MTVPSPAFPTPERSEIATLQKTIGAVFATLVFTLCAAGVWLSNPGLLMAGAVLLASTPIIVALQCLWMAMANRSAVAADLAAHTGIAATPALPWRLLPGLWWRETLTAWRVFGIHQPWAWRSEPNVSLGPSTPSAARGQRGVVLVHGFFCNRGLWLGHLKRLRAQGVPCIAVNLEPAFGSIDRYAPLLEEAVEALHAATGQAPVMLCHSMGGLAARAWLRSAEPHRVHRVITLGTPHHGTAIASAAHARNGKQMQVLSPWLLELAAHESNGPGVSQQFDCVYSDGDNIVFPSATAVLPGSAAHFVPACGHVDLVEHPISVRLLTKALA